jgi:predicted peptidase
VKQGQAFPFIIVSPQCPAGQQWDNDVLLALLDDIEKHYRVDTSRVYLTGLSMGGYGTWSLGLKYPERFAAIVPICGGGDPLAFRLTDPKKAEAIKSLGIRAFHGAKDPTVPVAESERMVDALKKIGCKEVELTIYPDAQHDSWTETYNNPKVFEWLLAHQRK